MSPLQCPGLHSVKLPALTSHIPFRPFHSECMFIGPKAKVCFPFLDFSNIRFPFTLQKGEKLPVFSLDCSWFSAQFSPCRVPVKGSSRRHGGLLRNTGGPQNILPG